MTNKEKHTVKPSEWTCNRRRFLKTTIFGLGGLTLPYPVYARERLPQKDQIVFRFAVGGDLHFGQGRYRENTPNMVKWLNAEHQERGLDVFFFNGDIVHDVTDQYEMLRDDYLSKLTMPYYAIKGNHDFLRADQTWEDIWSHHENHVVNAGDVAFVIADTSRNDNMRGSNYTAPDYQWMAQTLQDLRSKQAVFIMLHIAQRREGVHGWPRWGLGHHDPSRTEAGERVMALFESTPNVKAIFHSHNHQEKGRYLSGGKPYFFCSRLGSTWGNTIGYRIVEIYRNGTARTYQYDPAGDAVLNTHQISRVGPFKNLVPVPCVRQ